MPGIVALHLLKLFAMDSNAKCRRHQILVAGDPDLHQARSGTKRHLNSRYVRLPKVFRLRKLAKSQTTFGSSLWIGSSPY